MKTLSLVFALVLGSSLATVGCSGSDNGNSGSGSGSAQAGPLYDTPANAKVTPGDVHGTWGGSQRDDVGTIDFRVRVEDGQIELANRCTFPNNEVVTVYVSAKARITDASITIEEAKQDSKKSADGKEECNVATQVREYMYTIDGTKLMLEGAPELTKLTD
jgi:hypothetical protein